MISVLFLDFCVKYTVHWFNKTWTLICLCWFISSQDAHELFHVLTSSLEEERDRKPKITHFFDMQSLEASYQAARKHFSHASFSHLWLTSALWRWSLEGGFGPVSTKLSLPPSFKSLHVNCCRRVNSDKSGSSFLDILCVCVCFLPESSWWRWEKYDLHKSR